MPSNSRRKKHSVLKTTHNKQSTSGSVRIIAGKYRGRKLVVRNAEGLRPTTDRIKETLFNWLIGDISEKNVLDMYAGSGSLGFEALSRGAANATFFERDKNTCQLLVENAKLLNVESCVSICNGDSHHLIKELNTAFELVFVDPPFKKNLLQSSLVALINEGALADKAKIYVEHESDFTLVTPNNFEIIKQKQTKSLHATLFEYHR